MARQLTEEAKGKIDGTTADTASGSVTTGDQRLEIAARRDRAIEAAAKRVYEDKGDRVGVLYVGWENEPEANREKWREDVRVTIDAYEDFIRLRDLLSTLSVLLPATPKSLHWLGDREQADETQHAVDRTGCVMYFNSRPDCEAFMSWLTRHSTTGAS